MSHSTKFIPYRGKAIEHDDGERGWWLTDGAYALLNREDLFGLIGDKDYLALAQWESGAIELAHVDYTHTLRDDDADGEVTT